MQDFTDLFQKVGFEIEDKKLLQEAFTHRSAVNEHSENMQHNERLEFLGDAVLELITTDYLFKEFDKPEGELTNFRSALVKGDHLAEVAKRLGMGSYLLLSKGEAKSGGAEKDYLLANLLEAVIGAVYLEKGLNTTRKFIKKFIICDLEEILKQGDHIDAKSEFQEISQGTLGITPHYKVLSESGLDHDKTFVMTAYLEEDVVGQGTGRSKKEAQIAAAQDALDHKDKWLKEEIEKKE